MAADEQRLRDILVTLTPEQLRFVERRMYEVSDAEAARRLGMSLNTVYGWDNKAAVNEAVQLARLDGLNVAQERLKRLVGKALDVLDQEMDTRAGRFDAATDVLNRVGLSQPRKLALTDPSGTREYRSPEELSDEELVAIATSGGDGVAGAED